jgi:uncharacterized C2H2 Zn-finger protein
MRGPLCPTGQGLRGLPSNHGDGSGRLLEVMSMVAVQCPKCELLFRSPEELDWHLRQDHRRSRGLGLPDRLHRPGRGGRRPKTLVNPATWFRRP